MVDPIISGIGWASELIEIAGGVDCYTDNTQYQDTKSRIISAPLEVIGKSFLLFSLNPFLK